MQQFTKNWTTQFIPLWNRGLDRFRSVPRVQALEIGTLEGRSADYFLSDVLTGQDSFLTIIDRSPSPRIADNLAFHPGRYKIIQQRSEIALKTLSENSFDFIYVDACGSEVCTLRDCVLAWGVLKTDGILIIDGPYGNGPRQAAIHTFLTAYHDLFEEISRRDQTILVKKSNGDCG